MTVVVDGATPLLLPEGVRGGAVTVATFDVVHRGHRDVILTLVEAARRDHLLSVVVTFDPHPLDIVNPAAAPPLLTTRDEKVAAIAALGVDVIMVLPFTTELAQRAAEDFVEEFLLRRARLRTLFVGYDHGFGRNRMGDAAVLQALGASRGFTVTLVHPVPGPAGHPISSTGIRRAIAGGDLAKAAEGLGRPYSVHSTVVPGDRRGRLLGYPTINLAPIPARKLLPPDGVYAVECVVQGTTLPAMLNLGGRPTWGDAERRLEAHLFDTAGDFYGASVEVRFVARIREVRAFPDGEALRAQLQQDEHVARALLRR
jgi:riboflavin kinase/FMN adenylyltransferase